MNARIFSEQLLLSKKKEREITTVTHLHLKLGIFSESNGQNASCLDLPLVILHFALINYKTWCSAKS